VSRPPQLLRSIICDDVRHEVGGKVSLMGVFSNFSVVNFMQPLPRFHIHAVIAVDGEGDHRVAIRIASREGDFKLELPGMLYAHVRSPLTDLYECTVMLALEGFQVPRPGIYDISFVVGDANTELRGPSFTVTTQKPPTVQ